MNQQAPTASPNLVALRDFAQGIVESFSNVGDDYDGGEAVAQLQGLVEDASKALAAGAPDVRGALQRIRAAARCEGEFEHLSGRSSGEQIDAMLAIADATLSAL